MKFSKNWKRFWTLDRHHAEGFTLVELIVVIAILAILAGVAVPAYSGYVTNANKQADITLISDIEHALTLAGYNGTFADGETGYVVLSVNGIKNTIADGSSLDVALSNAFGASYKDNMKLSFGKWGNNGLMSNLDPERAYAVNNSSFMTGGRTDMLLGDVEKMTGMAVGLVNALGGGTGVDTQLSDVFTKDGVCTIDATAAKYGITKDDGQTWEQWAAASTENSTAYSNLLVLTAADEAEKQLAGGEDMSQASSLILEFSSYYAYAASNPEFSATLDDCMNNLNTVNSAAAGNVWLNDLKSKANAAGYADYESNKDQVFMDQVAFLSMLAGIGNPSEDQAAAIGKDLSNANLFTSGAVNGMYNDFLNMATVMAGMDLSTTVSVGEGEVAVLYSQNGVQVVVSNTLPQ